MTLSENQLRKIQAEVEHSNLFMSTLKADVLDHLCSATEHKIGEGKTFEGAFRKAFYDLAAGRIKRDLGMVQEIRFSRSLIMNQSRSSLRKYFLQIGHSRHT